MKLGLLEVIERDTSAQSKIEVTKGFKKLILPFWEYTISISQTDQLSYTYF